jgi:predicted ATPase/DNA-binding XRE family transcriptional regulator
MLLRRYRLAAGLSQEALAERARMSINGISALERGYRRTPQHDTVALLAGALALDEGQREEFEATAARSAIPRRLGGASVTIGPWSDTAISNLPLALKSFVGRETELDEIIALLGSCRLVTLAGAGGLGKTEIALHVGRALNDRSGSTVCFATLASIGDSSLVVTTIASAIGIQEVRHRPLLETLSAYLKNKSLVVILDNCEHVLGQAAIVAERILSTCQHVRILATSRESLRAPGEHIYRLPPLGVPPAELSRRIGASNAASYGAIALFTDRARAVDHRFALTDENAPAVAALCRQLDGIPLAIELAAARVNHLSPKALARRLDDRFRILTGGERTALERQQTMRATIDWSYDLLSTSEQRVFERLSVFAGGSTIAEATAVCAAAEVVKDDTFDLLSSLVDKSLVTVDPEGSEPRYRLLESFRQYGREKLAARGERELIMHRHALAYLETAQRLERAFFDRPDNEVLFTLGREEQDNWRAALQWTLTHRGNVLMGQRLVGELSPLWQFYAPVEGRRWMNTALELVDEQTPTRVLAKLRYTEAVIAMSLDQDDIQLASSKGAIALYRVLGDPFGIALSQSREAAALQRLGRYAESKLVLEEALPLARGTGKLWLVAWLLRLSGGLSCYGDNDFTAARRHTLEALRTYEALGSTFDAAYALMDLGFIEFSAGDAEQAILHVANALAMLRPLNAMRGIVRALNYRTGYLVLSDRYEEAQQGARELLKLAREHHMEDIRIAWALQHFAAITALRPRVDAGEPEEYALAARLLGFVDARFVARGATRDDAELQEYGRAVAALRETLGADVLSRRMAEGAAMTEEQAVQEVSR